MADLLGPANLENIWLPEGMLPLWAPMAVHGTGDFPGCLVALLGPLPEAEKAGPAGVHAATPKPNLANM